MALDQDLATLVTNAALDDVLQAHLVQGVRDSGKVAPTLTIQEMGPSAIDCKLAIVTALIPIYMDPQVGGGDEAIDASNLKKAFDAVWAQFNTTLAPVNAQQLPL